MLRNLDVGSYHAGVRAFYSSLLVTDAGKSPTGAQAVARYADLETPRSLFRGHRPDGLAKLKAVTLITWSDLTLVLAAAARSARREDERGYATRPFDWMRERGLIRGVTR